MSISICSRIRLSFKRIPNKCFEFWYVKSSYSNFPLKAIYTTAVLQPPHRKLIEEVFQTKIFDQYGCADSGGHASECGEGPGYHISFETSICEFVNQRLIMTVKK